MIKLAGRTGLGEPLLILGLSRENITRLTEGQPIHVDPREMQQLGLPGITVVIHFGETERAILDEFAAHGVDVQSAHPPGACG
jgi:hypothetical protein